jgi:hypothetical protein
VIARNKVKTIECRRQLFQTAQTVLQGLHVYGRTLVAPIAKKHTGFATIGSGGVNKPINKITAILIVL